MADWKLREKDEEDYSTEWDDYFTKAETAEAPAAPRVAPADAGVTPVDAGVTRLDADVTPVDADTAPVDAAPADEGYGTEWDKYFAAGGEEEEREQQLRFKDEGLAASIDEQVNDPSTVDTNMYDKALDIARKRRLPHQEVIDNYEAYTADPALDFGSLTNSAPVTAMYAHHPTLNPTIMRNLEGMSLSEALITSYANSWDKGWDQLEIRGYGEKFLWGGDLDPDEEKHLAELQRRQSAGPTVDDIALKWGLGPVQEAIGKYAASVPNTVLEEAPSEVRDFVAGWQMWIAAGALKLGENMASSPTKRHGRGWLAGKHAMSKAKDALKRGGPRLEKAVKHFGSPSAVVAKLGVAFQNMETEAAMAAAQYRGMTDDDGNVLDDDTVRGMSFLVGAVNGSLDAVFDLKVLKKIPGASQLLGVSTRRGVRRLLRQPAMRRTLVKLGKIAALGGVEMVTEAIQEMFTIGIEAYGLNKMPTAEEILERVTEALYKASQFGIAAGTVAVSVESGVDAVRAHRAKGDLELLKKMGENAKNTEATRTTPRLFQEHAQDVAETQPEMDPSLPRDTALRVAESYEGGRDKFAEDYPALDQELRQEGTQDEVSITPGELSLLATHEDWNEDIAQDVRRSPEEMTGREADVFLEDAEVAAEQAQIAAEQDLEADPRAQVEERLVEMLAEAGRDPEVSRVDTQPVVEFIMTAVEDFKDNGVDIDPVALLESLDITADMVDLDTTAAAFDPETAEVELPAGVVAPLGLDMTSSLDPDVPTLARLPALQEAPLREDFDSDEEFARAEAIHEEGLAQREVAKEFLTNLTADDRVIQLGERLEQSTRRRTPVKIKGPPQDYKLTSADKKRIKELRAKVPGLSKILRHLAPDEQALLDEEWATELVKMYDLLPATSEMAAVARAGIAKRGWYRRSQFALDTVFGEDAPRFTLLLAAMSPQTSVESNTVNALAVWNAWVAADRPTGREAIIAIMGANVQGDKGEDSVLGAWKNNAVRALGASDATVQAVTLSGPKVNSFNLNLRGFPDEVTNDAWVANFSLVDQALFGKAGELPGKGYGYMAMSARTRAAMGPIGWQPMEGQETIWSWTKALYEMAQGDPDRTALQILEAGDLTHEIINDTPDFEVLFASDGVYRSLLEAGGYTAQLDELKDHLDKRPASTLTGSVYDADSPDGVHLRRAAKRLDELVEVRAAAKRRTEIKIGISSSTMSIPGLAKLQREARMGDASAHILLQEIAADALDYLTDAIDSAELDVQPAYGLYSGDQEPALGLTVSFKGEDRERVLAALARFADNFNQEQIHVREDPEPGTKIGTVYPDGSYNTPVYIYELVAPLTANRVQEIIDASGLIGMTVTDTTLTAYYLGDPKDDEAIADFQARGLVANERLGADGRGVHKTVDRIWAYGDGYGATHGFEGIKRNFRPPRGDRANATAQRIAARLAGREFAPVAQVKGPISEDQKILQTRIARAYRDMKRDNLSDPFVRKAYTEMAAEIIRQYGSLPIKVEFWRGKGEPYKGKNMSEKLRQDVLYNNHMYVYATEPDQFGPEGVTYEDHPLLAETGYQDANGNMMLVNDLFRAIHDYIAHTTETAGFGPKGEEAAWRNHMAATPNPWAKWGITSETRGQNSWVNFHHKKLEGVPLSQRPFADQKVDLLPIEFMQTGEPGVDADLGELPGSEGLVLEQEARGAIEFGAALKSFRILFSGQANLSTFTHESAHLFVLVLEKWVKEGIATPRQREILDALYEYAGAQPGDVLTREQHEMIAEAYERYIGEGVAPSKRLRPAFAMLRKWMQMVYQGLKLLGVNLTPEVTQAFDRLLATDQAIADATEEFAFAPAFQTAEDAGMTPEEYQAYVEKYEDAEARALNDADVKILKQWRKSQNREQKQARKDMVDEAAEEVRARPVYAVTAWLRGRGAPPVGMPAELYDVKLSSKAVRAIVGKVEGKRLNFLTRKKDGVHPDVIAPFFGFESGEVMLQTILDAEPINDVVQREVDEAMALRFGDQLLDGTTPEEAARSLHIDEVTAFLMAELQALSKKSNVDPTPSQVLKAAARTVIDALPVFEIRPDRYRHAAKRAGQAAEKAMAEGDFVLALQMKQQQILNRHMAEYGVKAKDEGKLRYRQIKRYTKTRVRAHIGKIGEKFLNAIDAVLAQVEMSPATNKEIDTQVQLRVFYAEQLNEHMPVQIAPEMLESVETRNVRELSLDELRTKLTALKSIEHAAKHQDKITIAGQEQEISALLDHVDAATQGLRPIKQIDVHDDDNLDLVRDQFRNWNAKGTKVEFWMRALDGGEIGGDMAQATMQRMAEAQKDAFDRRSAAFQTLDVLFRALTPEQIARWNTKFEWGNRTLSGKRILVIALNSGNPENFRKTVEGYAVEWGLTVEQARERLDELMLKEDWDFVQGIWDLYEAQVKEDLFDVWQRMSGIRPEEVKAEAIETRHGTYRGGYYPMFYDPTESREAFEHQEKDQALGLMSTNFLQAKARTGAGHARSGYTGKVLLDFERVGSHVAEQIHFITHAEAVRDVDRLFRNRRFEALFKKTFGNPAYQELRPWLTDIAQDGTAVDHTDLGQFMGFLREGATVGYLGFNIGTMSIQTLGLAVTMGEVGVARTIGGGLNLLTANEIGESRVMYAWNNSAELSQTLGNTERDVKSMDRALEAEMHKAGKVKRARNALTHAGIWGIGAVQLGVNFITWQAGFDRAIAEGKTPQQAIAAADGLVRQTQGASGMKDLSAVQRGSEISKGATMFYNWGNVLRNQFSLESRNPSTKTIQKIIYVIVVMSALEAAGDEAFDDDEDKDNKNFWEHWWENAWQLPFSALPYGRAIPDMFEYGINPFSALSNVDNVLRKASKAYARLTEDDQRRAGEKDETPGAVLEALLGILALFKIPGAALQRKYNKWWGDDDS